MPADDQSTASGAGQECGRGISALGHSHRMIRGRNWALALAGAIAILVATTAAAQTPTYTFTPIDVPGAAWTVASSINDTAQIIGTFWDGTRTHVFLNSGGSFTTIDIPGASNIGASGINNAGQIVGMFLDGTGWHGFIYSAGSFTIIDVPLYQPSLSGINTAGQIVGSFGESIDVDHGFLRNVDGSITTVDVPGAISTDAYGINDLGQIVGWFDGQGFLDVGGSFTTINVPGAFSDGAYGINNAGQIVGGYSDRTGNHGFVATPAQSSGLAQLLGRSTNQANTLMGGAHVFTSPAKNGR